MRLSKFFILAGCFIFAGLPATNGRAVEVSIEPGVTVEPTNYILHSVQAKDVADQQRQFLQLRGPVMASEIRADGPRGYLSWYKIGNAKSRAATQHQISIGDGSPISVTLGQPAFLLAPSQQITEGSPPEPPSQIGFFKAFELDEASAKAVYAQATAHSDVNNIDQAKPSHIAIAAEYWHHDEHTDYGDKTLALVICQNESLAGLQSNAETLTILDSFGINQLTVTGRGAIVVVVKIEAE